MRWTEVSSDPFSFFEYLTLRSLYHDYDAGTYLVQETIGCHLQNVHMVIP